MAPKSTVKPLHEQLLAQAGHLATKERAGKPLQASLRRAISTAYYSIFHLLIHEAVHGLARGKGSKKLRLLLSRAFEHGEMARACRSFASRGPLPGHIQAIYGAVVVPSDLADVAQAFVDLQKARHDADYAVHERWSRTEAIAEVDRAKTAFKSWASIRTDPLARLFLVYLLTAGKLAGR